MSYYAIDTIRKVLNLLPDECNDDLIRGYIEEANYYALPFGKIGSREHETKFKGQMSRIRIRTR